MREKLSPQDFPANKSWLPVQGAHASTLRLVDLLKYEPNKKLDKNTLVLPPSIALVAAQAPQNQQVQIHIDPKASQALS